MADYSRSKNYKKQGFTLLEMSMVIVIIGLLVGAITVTTSFLTNAKYNTVMTESKYYINAFQQFSQLTSTRHSTPGDFSAASTVWAGAVNGDGNGAIRAGTSNNAEYFAAFQHLALSGLLRGSYTGVTGTGGSAVGIPGSNIGSSAAVENLGFFFDHPDAMNGSVSGDGFYFDGKYGHVLRVAVTTAGGMPTGAFLTPVDALKIDDKFDDGTPNKGWITSPNTSFIGCASTTGGVTTYKTTVSTKVCSLILNIQQ